MRITIEQLKSITNEHATDSKTLDVDDRIEIRDPALMYVNVTYRISDPGNEHWTFEKAFRVSVVGQVYEVSTTHIVVNPERRKV